MSAGIEACIFCRRGTTHRDESGVARHVRCVLPPPRPKVSAVQGWTASDEKQPCVTCREETALRDREGVARHFWCAA